MKHYDNEFKQKAIKLASEIGSRQAAQVLNISFFTLSDWRRHNKKKKLAELSLMDINTKIEIMEKELELLKENNKVLCKTLDCLLKSSPQNSEIEKSQENFD